MCLQWNVFTIELLNTESFEIAFGVFIRLSLLYFAMLHYLCRIIPCFIISITVRSSELCNYILLSQICFWYSGRTLRWYYDVITLFFSRSKQQTFILIKTMSNLISPNVHKQSFFWDITNCPLPLPKDAESLWYMWSMRR